MGKRSKIRNGSNPPVVELQQQPSDGVKPLGDGPPWMERPLWLAIVAAMRLDDRLRPVFDGLLRELNNGEIARLLNLPEDAVKN